MLDPPPEDRVDSTLQLLAEVGAIRPNDHDPDMCQLATSKLTRLGVFAAALPLDIRLSKLVSANERQIGRERLGLQTRVVITLSVYPRGNREARAIFGWNGIELFALWMRIRGLHFEGS